VARFISAEAWRPKDVATLEPNANLVVRSEENTLVIAGPGAGKTELLAQRACYLLETGGCPAPQRILAISFKKDAAKNLRERVIRRVGVELARRFDSFTFDAFSKSLLDRFLPGLPPVFAPTRDYVIDTELGTVSARQRSKLRTLLDSVADDTEGLSFAQLQTLDAASVYSNHVIGAVLPSSLPKTPALATAAGLALWQYLLRGGQRSVLSFPMIARLAELLLRQNPLLLRALHHSYSFVFLDEFQDTTRVHHELTKAAFLGSQALLTAVGDEKQRIMIWAGALRGIFAEFKKDFAANVVGLTMNYRSAPNLVRIQSHLALALDPEAETPKAANLDGGDDGECRVLVFADHEGEAETLSELISGWLDEGKLQPRNICILTRNLPERYTELLRERLESKGVPTRVEAKLQDLLAEPLTIALLPFLKVAVHERAPEAWDIATELMLELAGYDPELNRREAHLLTERLAAFCKTLRTELEAADDVETALASLKTITEFLGPSSLQRLFPQYQQGSFYDETLAACAAELAHSRSKTDDWKAAIEHFEGINTVPIMTIHKSKGLEYHTVVFVGLEDSALWAFRRNPEEETCGVFVAFSRAKKRVVFTYCEVRPGSDGRPTSQHRSDIGPIYELLSDAGVSVERIG